MIKKLQNNDIEVAENMADVFRLSYSIEAKLLNATNFPPLKRTLDNYIHSTTTFFGYFIYHDLAGVIEISNNSSLTHINSLVVKPEFFKQGVATKLIAYVFDIFNSDLFVVETGLKNQPATSLYKKFGFIEVEQWDTDFGVRKVKFEKRIRTKV